MAKHKSWAELIKARATTIVVTASALIAGLALVFTNLVTIRDGYKKIFASAPLELSVIEARALGAYIQGKGDNRGRGYSFMDFHVEALISKKGDNKAVNCNGEVLIAFNPAIVSNTANDQPGPFELGP